MVSRVFYLECLALFLYRHIDFAQMFKLIFLLRIARVTFHRPSIQHSLLLLTRCNLSNTHNAHVRYFSEMLQAQFMGRDVDIALNVFREAHSGTLSGMTRFRDHLDDMPATGYV